MSILWIKKNAHSLNFEKKKYGIGKKTDTLNAEAEISYRLTIQPRKYERNLTTAQEIWRTWMKIL